jgi:hypothetical protein
MPERLGDYRPIKKAVTALHGQAWRESPLRAQTTASLLTASPAPDSLFPTPFHGCFRHSRLSIRK